MTNNSKTEFDARDLDERAQAALTDEAEFELLFTEYRPFLWSRASRLAGQSKELREEMIHIASMAFFESVKSYDPKKGHFFQFMNIVVHKRLIDRLRKLYARRVEIIPLENNGEEGEISPSNLDKASISASREEERRYYLENDIECFKAELAEWNITFDELVAHSQKHSRLRKTYNRIITEISNDADIMQIIFIKRYFPTNKISILTKVPPKTVERGRKYILASLIILISDYDSLKGYVDFGPDNGISSGKGVWLL